MRAIFAAVCLFLVGCGLDVGQELEDKYDAITCEGWDARAYSEDAAVTYRLEVLSEAGDAWLTPAGQCEPTLCYAAAPGELVQVMNNVHQHDLIRWNVVIDATNAPCEAVH